MHNHQSKVVGECIRNEEPATREILKPDLRFVVIASVHQCKSAILNLRVNVKSRNVLSTRVICYSHRSYTYYSSIGLD